jgi:RNA polymerase sigma factor (sigma-70 family)
MTDNSSADVATESLVRRAGEGDANALDALIRSVQQPVFNMAIRMLWHPQDAEDATQEILLKVVTRLATFRGESSFQTWVYRVATNHLLNTRQSRVEREEITFSDFAVQLANTDPDAVAPASSEADQQLLELEVKIGCTQGMLLCLDRDHRIAYILGDIFELKSEQAGDILGIEPATFRKRLSRARAELRAFMLQHCGIANESAACRCENRIPTAIKRGRLNPANLLFASSPRSLPVHAQVAEVEELHRIAGIFRSHPTYAAPERVRQTVVKLIGARSFSVLE